MLLKVSDGEGGWVLFDHVDKAHLVSKSHAVRTPAELSAFGDEDTLTLIAKDCFRGEIVNVGIIEFERKGITRKAFFTNVVFICNDSGDTLDRLNAERQKRR